MGYPVGGDGILQGLRNGLLPNYFFKGLRTPFPGQD
jgi:hypothetical protein